MNERIRLLAEQANIHFSRVGILDGDPDGTARYVGYAKLEMLVELIVAECLVIVNRKEYSYHEADPLWETAQLIKQHFGVPE